MKGSLLVRGCLMVIAFVHLTVDAASFSSRFSFRVSSYRSSGSSSRRYGASRGSGFATLALLVSNRFSYRVNRLSYSNGIFFAPTAWRISHPYYSAGSTLCFNVMDDLAAKYNSSVVEPWLYQSRTVMGMFVCPMEDSRLDKTYCCGTEDRQYCCTFWDDAGRVAGLFVGLGVGLITGVIAALQVYNKFFRNKGANSSQVADVHDTTTAVVVTQPTVAEAPMAMAPVTAAETPAYGTLYPPVSQPAATDTNASKLFGDGEGQQPPLPQGDPNNPPPYPGFAPPSYWEANSSGGATAKESMPPVRF